MPVSYGVSTESALEEKDQKWFEQYRFFLFLVSLQLLRQLLLGTKVLVKYFSHVAVPHFTISFEVSLACSLSFPVAWKF